MVIRRFGQPLTEEQRAARHYALTGETTLPARGTGIASSNNGLLYLLLIPGLFLLGYYLLGGDKQEASLTIKRTVSPTAIVEVESKPLSGKTFQEQSDESYCLECIEGHTMLASTEMRHAIDRYRTAGEVTPGVTEKVRVAIGELQGIVEDARNTQEASPEVKEGINEILDEVRWIRKEYGLSGKGLTTGHGTEQDLVDLRGKIGDMQKKTYDLVSKCPTCVVK